MTTALRAAEVEAVFAARDEMSNVLQKISQNTDRTGISLAGAAETAIGFALATTGLQVVGDVFGFIKNSVISLNDSMDVATIRFGAMGMTSEEARKHVEGLFEYAHRTPFDEGVIVRASETMRKFGGATLDTQQNLQMLVDAAAATGMGVDSLGNMFGRMYGALQNGLPISRYLMTLQRSGVVTGDVVAKIKDMEKAGASSSAIWEVLTQNVDRFRGTADKLATTWGALITIIKGKLEDVAATTFKPFFEMAKAGLLGLADWLRTPQVEAFAAGAANVIQALINAFQQLAGPVLTLLNNSWKLLTSILGPLIDRFFPGVSKTAQSAGGILGWISGVINTVAKALSGAVNWILQVQTAFYKWIPVQAIVKTVGDAIAFAWQKVRDLASAVGQALQPTVDAIRGAFDAVAGAVRGFIGAIQGGADPIDAVGRALTDLGVPLGIVNSITGALDYLGGTLQFIWNTITSGETPIQMINDFLDAMGINGPVAQGILNGIAGAFEAVGRFLQPVADAMNDVVTNMQGGQTAWEALGNTLEKFGVLDAINSALTTMKPLLEPITGFVSTIGDAFHTFFSDIAANKEFGTAIENALSKIIGKGNAATVVDTISNSFKWIVDHKTEVVESFTAIGAAIAGIEVAQIIGNLSNVAQGVGTVTRAFQATAMQQGFMAALGSLIGPTGIVALVVIALAALVVGLIWLYNNVEPVRKVMDQIGNTIKEGALWAFGKLKDLWDAMQPTLKTLWEHMQPLIAAWERFVGVIIAKVLPIVEKIAIGIGTMLIPIIGVLIGAFNGILNAVIAVFPYIVGIITGVLDTLTGIFNFFADLLSGNWSKLWDDVKQIFAGVWEIVQNVFMGAIAALTAFVIGFVQGVVGWFQWLWSMVDKNVKDGIDNVVEWFKALPGRVMEFIVNLVQGIITFFVNLWYALVGGSIIPDLINGIVEWFRGLPGKILSVLGNAAGWLLQKGRDLVQGLWDGAVAIWSGLSTWLGNLGKSVVGALPWDFASKLWYAGYNIISGLWNGMVAKWNDIANWLSGLANWIRDHKGPISKDAGLLYGSGLAIMSGLNKGMREGWADVQRTIRSMNATLPTIGAGGIGGMRRAGAGLMSPGMLAVGGGVRDVYVTVAEGAYIDGPSTDMLTNRLVEAIKSRPGT